MMHTPKCIVAFGLSMLLGTALAQTPTPPPSPAQDAANGANQSGNSPSSNGFFEIGGMVDGYYTFNFNHPANHDNKLNYFDLKANQLSLSMAKLSIDHTPDPVGFKLELGFGRGMDAFHATEPAGVDVVKNIFQAYVSVKPEQLKGLQFDFGKFVTSAGAEVTESYLNWNYSRSLLYANGPFYHFGARVTMPVGSHFLAGVQLVNGWNNVEDNNTGKTVGLTGAFTSSKVTWYNNFYFGPEKNNTNKGYRYFYDTVVGLNPNKQVNFLFNFDYGQDNLVGGGADKFYGFSILHRLQTSNERWALSPRYDWYKDRNGLITGTAQTLQSFTLTGGFRMAEGFLTRLEYRRDWSGQPFFDRGNELANAKQQSTIVVGLVVYFNGKRL